MTEFEENTFMNVLDMCGSLDTKIIQIIIDNLEIMIENKEEDVVED